MNTAPRIKFSVHVLVLAFGLTTLAASAAAQGFGFHGNGEIAPRGVPASVTSFGFGGHPGFHGVPASVTSLGFGGHPGFRGVPPSVTSLGFGAPSGLHEGPGRVGFGDGRHAFHGRRFEHRHHRFYPGIYGAYYGYAPYAYPYDLSGDDSAYDSSAYADRASGDYRDYDYRDDDDRQVLERDYRAEMSRAPEQTSQSSPQPVAAQPSTVLIFKDGHQQEVSNYAIIGATLYELSDGRSKKVQLTDLDLTATIRENDQRGVEFQLPAATKFN